MAFWSFISAPGALRVTTFHQHRSVCVSNPQYRPDHHLAALLRRSRAAAPRSCTLAPESTNAGTAQFPTVVRIVVGDVKAASAVFISPSYVLTALHTLLAAELLSIDSLSALPPGCTELSAEQRAVTIDVEGDPAQLLAVCVDADLALLQLHFDDDDDVDIRTPAEDANEIADHFTHVRSDRRYVLLRGDEHMPVVPVDVAPRMTSHGALVPMLRLRIPTNSSSLRGWSGAPVIDETDGRIIGLLTQGDGRLAHAVPAPVLSRLFAIGAGKLDLFRLPGRGVAVQPGSPPRVARVQHMPGGPRVGDHLLRVNGEDIGPSGGVQFAGVDADVSCAALGGTWKAVVRRREDGKQNEREVEVKLPVTRAKTVFCSVYDQRTVQTPNGFTAVPLGVGWWEHLHCMARRYETLQSGGALGWLDALELDVNEDGKKGEIVLLLDGEGAEEEEEDEEEEEERGLMERVLKVNGEREFRLEDLRHGGQAELSNGFVVEL